MRARRRPPPPGLGALAASTPAGRDRLVDLVRAASIVVVALGHWMMAALEPRPDGALRVRNILEVTTWAHPLTWLLQVMPLFFFAAGFTSALALRRRRTWSEFAGGRLQRVLPPTLLFVAVWLVLSWALVRVGVPSVVVDAAGDAAAMPLWFLAVFLLLAVLAPAQHAVHRRWPWALLPVLPVVALLLDRLQGTALAPVGYLNYVVVFGFSQELGFLYADGRLVRARRRWWVLATAGALAALVLLTGPGPYPVSMLGLPGQRLSNMLPPSVCVIAVGVVQLGVVMLARPALLRWLQRPRVWRATVAANAVVMTLFLWHITGLVLAAVAAYRLGLPLPPIGSARWWAEKPLWLLAAAVVTAGLVVLLSPVERTAAGRAHGAPSRWAGAAALLAVAGLTMVACAGFADPFQRSGIPLAGQQFTPFSGAALLALAWLLSRVGGRSAPAAVQEAPGGGEAPRTGEPPVSSSR
jgi:hypothetical protein